MATVSLRDEVTSVLQELIRLDTVNPPGNETRAAEYLRAYLEESGVACELYARIPERASLVARIPGRGDGPSLLFLSHTDTVLADASEWQVGPRAGRPPGGSPARPPGRAAARPRPRPRGRGAPADGDGSLRRARGRARARALVQPAGGLARRAAPFPDGVADDDPSLAEAERRPGALRGDRRLPPPPGPDHRRGGAAHQERARPGRLRARVDPGAGRDALAVSGPALGRRRVVRRRGRAGRARRADLRRGLHRQPLAPGGVRDGGVRVLPRACTGSRARRAVDPLCRRAGAGRRPRARRALPPSRSGRPRTGAWVGSRPWSPRRSSWAGWPCRTECSCMAPGRGPPPSASRTAASRWPPRGSGSARPTSSARSCAARPGCSRRSRSCPS